MTAKNKKNIVWIVTFPHPIYGAMLSALAKSSPELSVSALVMKRVERKPWGYDNIKWISLDSLQFGDILATVYLRELEKTLARAQPDVIVCNSYYSIYCFQAYRFAKRNNIPLIIYTEERVENSFKKKMLFSLWNAVLGKAIFEYSDYILALRKDSQLLMQQVGGVKEKVIYAPAGIDTDIFLPERKKNISKGKKIRFLMVARMISCKDHATALRAFHLLDKHKRVDFTLDLVGDGPLRDDIERMIREYMLEDKIRILSEVPHEKMTELYNAYNVIILSSTKEALGMVVPEAMACGLPAIVSDGTGARDYIQDGVNGFIFHAGDEKDLAEKIFVISKENILKMGMGARESIIQNFDVKKLARILSDKILESSQRSVR